MARPSIQTASLQEIINSQVQSDPILRERISKLINRVISYAEYAMEWGDDTTKTALMRAIVPSMIRSMESVQDDESRQRDREVHNRIMAGLRGEADESSKSD
jgi:hypothetical protein